MINLYIGTRKHIQNLFHDLNKNICYDYLITYPKK